MTARRAVAAWALAAALATGACVGGDEGGGDGTEPSAFAGRRAPTFTTTDFDGQRVRLNDYRGQTVVVNFWASWCTPCRKEFPLLAELDARDDVAVLGVLFNDSVENAKRFMAEHGATWPGLQDDGGIAKAYRVGPGIPASIVIGPNGVVTKRHLGEFSQLDQLIDNS